MRCSRRVEEHRLSRKRPLLTVRSTSAFVRPTTAVALSQWRRCVSRAFSRTQLLISQIGRFRPRLRSDLERLRSDYHSLRLLLRPERDFDIRHHLIGSVVDPSMNRSGHS